MNLKMKSILAILDSYKTLTILDRQELNQAINVINKYGGTKRKGTGLVDVGPTGRRRCPMCNRLIK